MPESDLHLLPASASSAAWTEAFPDPTERAIHLGRALEGHKAERSNLSALRRDAAAEMKASGMSLSAIGSALGVGKSMAAKLLSGR